MVTIYICRHGQTENNKYGRLSGWIDTPLTAEGVENALSSAAKLAGVHIDKIISSDMGRAFTTAYLISRELGYTAAIERRAGLREVNYGEYANKPYSAYPAMTPEENAAFIPENGESLAQMQKRVVSCLESIAADNPNAAMVLVAHDGTINALRGYFNTESIGIADLIRNPHDFVAKLEYSDGKITSFNEVT